MMEDLYIIVVNPPGGFPYAYGTFLTHSDAQQWGEQNLLGRDFVVTRLLMTK